MKKDQNQVSAERDIGRSEMSREFVLNPEAQELLEQYKRDPHRHNPHAQSYINAARRRDSR